MLRRSLSWVGFFCLLLATVSAFAQNDLYDNGPTDGQDLAWTINFGSAVSDSFTLSSNSTVNGLSFAAWMFPGDEMTSVEVAITSSEFGGTTYTDQTVNLTATHCAENHIGFNVCDETGSFGTGVSLSAGNYWLTLDNGCCSLGDPFYWDQNSGPSQASENSLGTIPSESFTLLGSSGSSSSSTGSTPEPGSLMLFGSAVLGVAGVLRKQF